MPPILGSGISNTTLSGLLREQYDRDSKNLSPLEQSQLMNAAGDQLRMALIAQNRQRALGSRTDLSNIGGPGSVYRYEPTNKPDTGNIHSSAADYYKYLGNLQTRRKNYVADGNKHGRVPKDHVATFHYGICGWCKKENIPVTEPRDYSYPELIEEK